MNFFQTQEDIDELIKRYKTTEMQKYSVNQLLQIANDLHTVYAVLKDKKYFKKFKGRPKKQTLIDYIDDKIVDETELIGGLQRSLSSLFLLPPPYVEKEEEESAYAEEEEDAEKDAEEEVKKGELHESIINYTIIYSANQNAGADQRTKSRQNCDNIRRQVRTLMQDGWEPHGSVSISSKGKNADTLVFAQAMVKYGNKK